MRRTLGLALFLSCGGCVLPEVPDDELGTLAPPCADGWMATADQRGCVRAHDAGAMDAGEGEDAGGAFDASAHEDAGGGDAGVDGGALVDAADPRDPDGGSDAGALPEEDAGTPSDAGGGSGDCFDPIPGGSFPPDAAVPSQPVINEYVFKHTAIGTVGTDYYEYVEIYGPPNTDLSDLSVVVVNSHDGRNLGEILHVIPIGRTNGAGFWRSCDGFLDSDDAFVQSSASLFLVRGFTGIRGYDLDSTNDGVLDSTPWAEVLDEVAFDDQDVDADTFYATPVLTPDGYDGHTLTGSRLGASRRVDGLDTDAEEDWRKNHYSGSGFPDVPSAPRASEAWNTPGAPNRVQ